MAIVEKRRLKSGTPVWLRKSPRILSQPLPSRSHTDVIVVGTGVSGALMADSLQRAGLQVLALDRRKIMSGSTPASTALLQSELDMPLTKLQKRYGKSDAARVWLRSAASVGSLAARISDLEIACDYRERDTLYLPGNELNAEELKRECTARQVIGGRSEYLDRAALRHHSGLNKAGAILTHGNAELDPVKLVEGLWKFFKRRGGKLVAGAEVTAADQSRSRVQLTINHTRHITANHVVFCTGYEVLKRVKPKGYKVISTWVLATKRQPQDIWKSGSLIWEAADPYLYLRSTADGRIIAGGEDEDFSDEDARDALTERKVRLIAAKAKQLWPRADFNPEFSWSGSFGESPAGLPAIGPISGLSRCYAVLGFGGNGITFSMLAAELVTRSILNLADADAGLFAL